VLSTLEANDSTAERCKSIRFFDEDKELIDDLAVLYEGLKPTVDFALSGSQNSKLPPELKDNSIDFILLDSRGVAEEQWTELLSNTVRILKPGGKLLTVGSVKQTEAK
jgi:hypothetical protein